MFESSVCWTHRGFLLDRSAMVDNIAGKGACWNVIQLAMQKGLSTVRRVSVSEVEGRMRG